MSNSALVMLVVCWSAVGLNMLYCFYKLLTSQRQFEQHDE